MAGAIIPEHTGLQRIMCTVCVSRTNPVHVVKNDLEPKLHILNLWLRRNVLPVKGHYEGMTPFEIYVLYYFLEGIILDLPTIILHEMIKINEIDH